VTDVNIDVADGSCHFWSAPSGSGKSTVAAMIVGLEDITSVTCLIG